MRLALRFAAGVTMMAALIFSLLYTSPALAGKSKLLPHFTDNHDGTITDNRSKKVWLKNIDCMGQKTWTEALSICKSLADGTCDLTDASVPGSWRMPYQKELQSLLDPGNFSPVLPPKHPFFGIKDGCYWLRASSPEGVINAHYTYVGDGGAGLGGMNICSHEFKRFSPAHFYLWPVRGDGFQME